MFFFFKFYLIYKYYFFGVGILILLDDKRFKNYVFWIYIECCGIIFNMISFWEYYF